MTSAQILFYTFSFFLVKSSLIMIFAKNSAKAVFFLVLAFFSVAGLWILLEAEFLAITLILVYVGAVMVLFLFVIKMLNIDKSTLRAKFAGYLPLCLIVSAIIVAEMTMVLGHEQAHIAESYEADLAEREADLVGEVHHFNSYLNL